MDPRRTAGAAPTPRTCRPSSGEAAAWASSDPSPEERHGPLDAAGLIEPPVIADLEPAPVRDEHRHTGEVVGETVCRGAQHIVDRHAAGELLEEHRQARSQTVAICAPGCAQLLAQQGVLSFEGDPGAGELSVKPRGLRLHLGSAGGELSAHIDVLILQRPQLIGEVGCALTFGRERGGSLIGGLLLRCPRFRRTRQGVVRGSELLDARAELIAECGKVRKLGTQRVGVLSGRRRELLGEKGQLASKDGLEWHGRSRVGATRRPSATSRHCAVSPQICEHHCDRLTESLPLACACLPTHLAGFGRR